MFFSFTFTRKKKKKKEKKEEKSVCQHSNSSKFRNINAIVIFLHVSNEKKEKERKKKRVEEKRKGEKFTVRNSTVKGGREGRGNASSRAFRHARIHSSSGIFELGGFARTCRGTILAKMTFRQWMLVNECNASPVIRAWDKIPRPACRSALLIRTFHPPCARAHVSVSYRYICYPAFLCHGA